MAPPPTPPPPFAQLSFARMGKDKKIIEKQTCVGQVLLGKLGRNGKRLEHGIVLPDADRSQSKK